MVRTVDWSKAGPYLQLELDQNPDFNGIALIKPDGSMYLTSNNGLEVINIKDRPYFQQAMAGKSIINNPIIARTSNNLISIFATPIFSAPCCFSQKLSPERELIRSQSLAFFQLPNNPNYRPYPIGVLTAAVPVLRIGQLVDKIADEDHSYAFVIDNQGQPLAYPDKSFLQTPHNLLKTKDPELGRIVEAMVHHNSNVELVKLNNEWVYVAYLPLHEANWFLALVTPQTALEKGLSILNLLALFIGLLLIIAIIVTWRQIQLFDATRIYAEKEALQSQQLAQTLKELQETQFHLIQSEKMSSLGQMVAGIAHEINNPVNFIHGNLTHVKEYTHNLLTLVELYNEELGSPSEKIEDYSENIDLEFMIEDLPKILNSMKIGTERIREIVLSLRNFSRIDEADMKSVDIHEGIDSTLLLLENKLKAKPGHSEIKIVKNYSDLPLVECYPGQLNQVFMNIINNAIDAIDEYRDQADLANKNVPSTITIRTELSELGYVTIGIGDNGPGISAEVQNRLFDPFFTTKPVGKGTGLGLSISYQIIVQKHGGKLSCLSAIGQGTEFLIEIPCKQQST